MQTCKLIGWMIWRIVPSGCSDVSSDRPGWANPDPGGRRGGQFVTAIHLCCMQVSLPRSKGLSFSPSNPSYLVYLLGSVACRPRAIVVRPVLCFTSRICLYFGYHKDAPWLFPMCCSSTPIRRRP